MIFTIFNLQCKSNIYIYDIFVAKIISNFFPSVVTCVMQEAQRHLMINETFFTVRSEPPTTKDHTQV